MSAEIGGNRERVTFRVTEDDFRAFQRERRTATGVAGRVGMALIALGVLGTLALWIAVGVRSGTGPWLPTLFLVIAGVSLPLGRVINRHSELRRARKLGLFDREWSVTLSPEGLHRSDPTGESLTRWDFVTGVTDAPSAVHVAFKDNTLTLVPRRTLGGPDQIAAFVARVRAAVG